MTSLPGEMEPRDSSGRLDNDKLIGGRRLARQFEARGQHQGSRVVGSAAGATASPIATLGEETDFVFRPPPQLPPRVLRFNKEQEFEGTVVAVDEGEGTFTARLVDLMHGSPEEEGEFSIGELDCDQHLVVPGALFTWTIGLQLRGTRQQRVSDIRFRRMPPFTQSAIARAEAEAEVLAKFLQDQNAFEPFTARPR